MYFLCNYKWTSFFLFIFLNGLLVQGQAFRPLLNYVRNIRGPKRHFVNDNDNHLTIHPPGIPPRASLGSSSSSLAVESPWLKPRFTRIPPSKFFTSPFHPRVQGHSNFLRFNPEELPSNGLFSHYGGGSGSDVAPGEIGVGGNTAGEDQYSPSSHEDQDPTFTPYIGSQALSNMNRFFDLLKLNLEALKEEELQNLEENEQDGHQSPDENSDLAAGEKSGGATSSIQLKWAPKSAGMTQNLRRFFDDNSQGGNNYFSPALRSHYQRPAFIATGKNNFGLG